jgi:methyl-accepting chemotaxis protein PixJ
MEEKPDEQRLTASNEPAAAGLIQRLRLRLQRANDFDHSSTPPVLSIDSQNAPDEASEEASADRASSNVVAYSPTEAMPNAKPTELNPLFSTAPTTPSLLLNGLSASIHPNSDLGWLLSCARQMHQASSPEALLNVAVAEVRQHFQVDRAMIFRLQSQTQGTVLAESLIEGYTPSLRETLPIVAFGASQPTDYWQQPFISLEDVEKRSLTPYQRQLLERFQVRASLSLPIVVRHQLWGLLVIQHCARPIYWQEAQILLLRQIATQLQLGLQPQDFERERQIFDRLTEKIHQAVDVPSLLQTVTRDVRQHLNVERVAICQFRPDYSGDFISESKLGDLPPLTGSHWNDGYIREQQGGRFRDRRPLIADNIHAAGLSDCHIEILDAFEIQACAIVPIFQAHQLWGVLCAYQHSSPHHWDPASVDFLTHISQLLGIALRQTELATEKQQTLKYRQELPAIIQKISSPVYLQESCQTAVQEAQKLLDVERVAIYKFRPDYFGDFIYESEPGDLPPLVGSAWEDTYLKNHNGGRFHQNEAFVVEDCYQAGLSACHLSTLEHFGIRSFAIVGIKQGEKLWGLLIAIQQSAPRHWFDSDVNLLTEIGQRLGMTLQEAEYLTQLQDQSAQMTKAAQVSQLVAEVIPRILQASSAELLWDVTSRSVRRLLQCDRVTIQQHHAGGWQWLAESLAPGASSLQPALPLPMPPSESLRQGNWVVNNIHTVGHTAEEIERLEELGIQAYATLSIFKQNDLWGSLSVYQSSARSWTEVELSALQQIAGQVGVGMQQIDYVHQLQQLSQQLAQTAEREQLVVKIVERVRQSLNLQQTFKTTAREIRSFLDVDRVAIFKFHLESGYSTGVTIAEDVLPGYVSALAVKVEDHCFSDNFAEMYRNGRICAISDIYAAGLPSCYIDVLAQFQVRADLVVPLLRGPDLWGLFCVHHCRDAREWSTTDIEFVKQIAAQLNVAIQQGEYVEQLQHQSEELASAAKQNKTAKEQLQREVMQLLVSVRPALDGDLTVRAPVTDTSVGTIADAYNNTLSSLQQIVMQMQIAATQVTQTSQASGAGIASLAAQAQTQLQALQQAIEQVQGMVQSTEVVESYVQQVETAVQQANQTVVAGDAAIDRTVDEMEEIREIVTETNQRLQRLSESSQKISKVVNVIGHFTTQTQLLALNAAIEATRAGEYGRGFAVVADEVRSLARQSANAAVEIEQLVQDIQAGTAEVATAMETSHQQVASGTRVVNEARDNLNSIVNATSHISQLVSEIASVMRQQTQQCQTVTQTMNQVAVIANQTSSDSTALSTSLQDLLLLAQDLQSKGDRFKVTR